MVMPANVAKEHEGFQGVGATDDSLLDPKAVVAEGLGGGGEGVDEVQVDGLVDEYLRECDAAGNGVGVSHDVAPLFVGVCESRWNRGKGLSSGGSGGFPLTPCQRGRARY